MLTEVNENKDRFIQKQIWVAGLLSLLMPGLGHFYTGKIKKGLIIHSGLWIYLIHIWFSPLLNTFTGLMWTFIAGIIYYLFNFIHAIFIAINENQIKWKWYDRWYNYIIIYFVIVLAFTFVYSPAKDLFSPYHFARTSSTSMSPALEENEIFAWKKTGLFNRGDVTVFNFPDESDILYIYRCVGMPGDYLEFKNGYVYINNTLSDNTEQLKFQYHIQFQKEIQLSQLQELEIEVVYQVSGTEYFCNMTNKQLKQVKNLKYLLQINPVEMEERILSEKLFPYDSNLNWTFDFYGPLKLPEKGQLIELNKGNASFYLMIMQLCENESAIVLNEQGLPELNGEVVHSYKFKHNYYFMAGDNRHNASDSRINGPVPDYLIKGKGLYSWISGKKKFINKKL